MVSRNLAYFGSDGGKCRVAELEGRIWLHGLCDIQWLRPGSRCNPHPRLGTRLPIPTLDSDPVTLQPKDGNVFSDSFIVEGIRTFNGDGSGTVNGTSIAITPPPTPSGTDYPHFPPSASSHNFTYTFTYTVNGDEELDIHHGQELLLWNIHGRSAHRANCLD